MDKQKAIPVIQLTLMPSIEHRLQQKLEELDKAEQQILKESVIDQQAKQKLEVIKHRKEILNGLREIDKRIDRAQFISTIRGYQTDEEWLLDHMHKILKEEYLNSVDDK